jgi:transposase
MEGCQNASELWRELKEQGFTGALGAVTRYIRLRMRDPAQIKKQYMRRAKTAARRFTLSSARRAAWLFLKDENELTVEEQTFVREMLKVESVARAVAVTKQFQELVRNRNIELFDQWLSEAETLSTKYKNFVKGLRRDYKAVRAAIENRWSNGQTEGQVNRLKFIKRQMYGRAKFDLLRARVLHRS